MNESVIFNASFTNIFLYLSLKSIFNTLTRFVQLFFEAWRLKLVACRLGLVPSGYPAQALFFFCKSSLLDFFKKLFTALQVTLRQLVMRPQEIMGEIVIPDLHPGTFSPSSPGPALPVSGSLPGC